MQAIFLNVQIVQLKIKIVWIFFILYVYNYISMIFNLIFSCFLILETTITFFFKKKKIEWNLQDN